MGQAWNIPRLPFLFAARSRRSVLLIFAEGWGHESRWPQADALAARGMRFERAYRQHTDPLISRASILNGTHPPIAAASPRLPQYLQTQGYSQDWRARPCFLASVIQRDEQLPPLLSQADDTTLIILTGEPAKADDIESAARVPLIIAGPETVRGAVCTRIVELLDIFPTIVALSDLLPLGGLDGRSLLSLLRDPQAPRDRPAYTIAQIDGRYARSVRTSELRYTQWEDGGAEVQLR